MHRSYFTYEALLFIAIFTLLFITTNVVMIDYRGIQSMVSSQDPFMILILGAILAYLYKNSTFSWTPLRKAFLTLWGLYIAFVFLSMFIADHFVFTEVLILLMVTVILFYKIPKQLIIYLVLAALISLPSLLIVDYTLNESGSTLVMVVTAGFLIVPRTNRAMILYMLPSFLLLSLITTSRTAMGTFLLLAAFQLAWINLYHTPKRQKKYFLGAAIGAAVASLILFAGRIYQFFIGSSLSLNDGSFSWNALTSIRYELWATVWHNKRWFGEGHSYFNFSDFPHAHNILFDTLGRYGIIAVILFILVLGAIWLLSITKYTLSISLFMTAYLLIGMFEYNYLFMFVYFSPIVLFFVLTAYMLTLREAHMNTIDIKKR
ncbi:O-antigen ligase domain-containing protein [Salinicoccus hispanicus]|uniref:O-antigen ligase domain-containing protein n=2 Tax=Salinicoccus hispanicus TaxID=157225 RepID=A0A6N8TY92_9STAP|nr:O-antigen ligase domain-containing protein [Salinicoccus hispanicus]